MVSHYVPLMCLAHVLMDIAFDWLAFSEAAQRWL
jgi:hypothetical protein